jgi:hypothetical protein
LCRATGNFERIESLFEAIAASGVDACPPSADLRDASRLCATAFR